MARIGRLICDKCGRDCTNLWGLILQRQGRMIPREAQERLSEIHQKYGQSDFAFCWECTAEVMGAKTIEEKKRLEAAKEKADAAKTTKKEQDK